MDFYQIRTKETRDGLELYPDFVVGKSKDLMTQGHSFYAIWDETLGLWSRDEYDVQRLVDEHLKNEADKLFEETGIQYKVQYMRSFKSRSWSEFKKFVYSISDNTHVLDTTLIFANTDVKKGDYASRRLPYSLASGDIPAWDELVSTLYSPDERAKIEWAVGSIVSGDSKKIQKFLVFYGPAGTGKSTILNILEKLFEGYTTSFDGKALGSQNAAFATEVFRTNPLVAIQHDGDLSRIEDNTRLNSIISHEDLVMNEKYKASYSARVNAMLFIGSNQPVKISDAKSGIIRRLIDVHPTGIKIPPKHYETLLSQIEFELGAIAQRCLDVYLSMGKNYYNAYRPMEMMLQTDVFFNFIEAHYDLFKSQNYTTLKQAYGLYKEFCSESGIERPLPQYKMREELRNYFEDFKDRGEVENETVRSLYVGFTADKFKTPIKEDVTTFSLVIEEKESLLDSMLAEMPAQKARPDGTPSKKWANVQTVLSDIDTSSLHYVKVPENHIVVDFDLKDTEGAKSLERNLEAASAWPPTYAELSQSGSGVHLHFLYVGDVSALSPQYAEGVEIKVYTGDSSLRRRLSLCNAIPVAEISSGLPLKEVKKVLSSKTMTSEKGLRELIERNLKKEIHPGTKPSIDFIHKVLEDAKESGMKYDVTDLRPRILAFANNSSNQANAAIKIVQQMKFSSEDPVDEGLAPDIGVEVIDDRIAFFDVEVYSNLFVICWKFQGTEEVVQMINPSQTDVEKLLSLKLVGFYNRRYDNHILYAAAMGYSIEKLYALSQALIVENKKSATFGAAYNLSYADIWDFSTKRESLKKFEIELGLHHMELDFPWDEPVEEKNWPRVVEYCVNDVIATEAVFESRSEDFTARQILAELSGLTVNDTTQRHTAKIIFGEDRQPQKKFIYTDLSKDFPGYVFERGKSSYKGEDPGEGGYVYAEPGIYENVALLDVVSMHPASTVVMNCFGPYTEKYNDIIKARMAIKRGDFESARKMFDGKLAPYLSDEADAFKLAYALKIAVNIVYGLTSAKFDNPFRDMRNVDNIVAKRGALFMIDLKLKLQELGYTVAHIKTDSVKIPNADRKVIEFVKEFGAKYGYEFEHEATYDKFFLANDAVYVAGMKSVPWDPEWPQYIWSATGSQYQHPYVFKSLFSHEEEEFSDFCESRSVLQGTMYLDLDQAEQHDYKKMKHLGKVGSFVPVLEGGGVLYRVKDDKYYAVTGTKGHLWVEAEIAKTRKNLKIDMEYFDKLKAEAIKAIDKFGSYQEFVS